MEKPLSFVNISNGVAPYNYEAAKPRYHKADETETAGSFEPDAFQIDDLLEFSTDDIAGPIIAGLQSSDHSVESSITKMVPEDVAKTNHLPAKASCQPSNRNPHEDHQIAMDLEFDELDWLSNFVEDSYSAGEHLKLDNHVTSSCMHNNKSFELSTNVHRSNHTRGVSTMEGSATSTDSHLSQTSIPGRARSKRFRSGVRIWSSNILASPLSQESSICDDPTECFFSSIDCSGLYTDVYSADSEGVRARQEHFPGSLEAQKAEANGASKFKKWRIKESTMQSRRCTHCLSQRTPQWRAGPLGPKTLCNACGVRYKSGRLFPEYRPAASPTFLSDVHSNSHRKVMQMRREKEITVHQTSMDLTSELPHH